MQENQQSRTDDRSRFGGSEGNGTHDQPDGEALGHQAKAAASRLRSELSSGAEQQKSAVASMIHDVADVIMSASEQLQQKRHFGPADYASSMGSGLADFSRDLEHKSLQDVMSDVSRFARQNPMMFVGGAMLAGMALSRLAKASGTSLDDIKQTVSETVMGTDETRGTMGSAGQASTNEAFR